MNDPGEPTPFGTQAAPRLSRARAFVLVTVGLAGTGLVVGALWAWIAPPIHGVVALTRQGERVHAYLGPESDHFFGAAALMLGLLGVVAVLAATWVWQWRAHRGPGMVVALAFGVTAAAALSVLVGALLVHQRYGEVDVDAAPVTADDRVYYFTEAPPVFFGHTPLQIVASVVLPAATAGLVYALCAAASARDDLGGYPVLEPPDAPVAVPPPVASDVAGVSANRNGSGRR